MDECIREIHAANDAASFWEQLYRGKDSVWKDTANPLARRDGPAPHTRPRPRPGLRRRRRHPLARHPRMARHRSRYRPHRPAAHQPARRPKRPREQCAHRTARPGRDLPRRHFRPHLCRVPATPYAFPRASVLRRAAHALTPGGILLIVDHGSVRPWAWNTDPTPASPARKTSTTNSPSTRRGGHPSAWPPRNGWPPAPADRPRPSPTRSLPYAAPSPDLPHPTHTAHCFRSYLHD